MLWPRPAQGTSSLHKVLASSSCRDSWREFIAHSTRVGALVIPAKGGTLCFVSGHERVPPTRTDVINGAFCSRKSPTAPFRFRAAWKMCLQYVNGYDIDPIVSLHTGNQRGARAGELVSFQRHATRGLNQSPADVKESSFSCAHRKDDKEKKNYITSTPYRQLRTVTRGWLCPCVQNLKFPCSRIRGRASEVQQN